MTAEAVRRTAVASVLLVALVAAVCSYCHMEHLARQAGEEWRSTIIPLSVDGMLVASTLAIVDRRRASHSAGWVPWLGLSLGILASLAANVAAARPDPIARVIAAWPPLAFAVAVETLVIVLRGTRAEKVPERNIPAPSVLPVAPSLAATPPPAPSVPKPPRIAREADKNSAETQDASRETQDAKRARRNERNRAYRERQRLARDAGRVTQDDAPRNGHRVLQDAK